MRQRVLDFTERISYVLLPFCLCLLSDGQRSLHSATDGDSRTESDSTQVEELTLLALGDVNLGRQVGQKILEDSMGYPFECIRGFLDSADIVFANLESQLSDQNGETQHPYHNLIFTGPPEGAKSLAWAGITIVSTANNHAFDYGMQALRETIANLDSAGVLHVGTSVNPDSLYFPFILQRKGLKIAFFACTDLMNAASKDWEGHIAWADTGKILPRVRSIRDSVDVIILSYHGGSEYSSHPTRRTRDFAHQMLGGGVDIFLGHHPHVPQGIERCKGKYVLYSLGNFVFHQPQRYWTQRSVGVLMTLRKREGRTMVDSLRCYPLRAGLQPYLLNEGKEYDEVVKRIADLSSRLTSRNDDRSDSSSSVKE